MCRPDLRNPVRHKVVTFAPAISAGDERIMHLDTHPGMHDTGLPESPSVGLGEKCCSIPTFALS